MSHDDYEKEPVPGLPARLPEGEHIVWQGMPDASVFLRHVLHARFIPLYFGALIAWRVVTGLYDGDAMGAIAVSVGVAVMLGAILFALAWWFSRAVARTTIYTITNKRVVMRFGIAIPVTFNYPFSQILSADMRQLGADSGTIALTLKEHTKVSWAVLWPHARPWKLATPQPAMRAVGDASAAAAHLTEGLTATHAGVGRPDTVDLRDTDDTMAPIPVGNSRMVAV